MLETMLEMQRLLQEKLGYDIANMSYQERVAYVKEYSIHLTQELHEMLYELPFFKPWKNYDGMTEEECQEAIERAKGEFIDMWHFLMNIMLGIGITGSELFDAYKEKNEENYRRQEAGYTHNVSYR